MGSQSQRLGFLTCTLGVGEGNGSSLPRVLRGFVRDGSVWHTAGAEEVEGFSDRGRSLSRPTSGLGKARDPRLGAVSLVSPPGPRAPSFPRSQWELSVQALTCAQGPLGARFSSRSPEPPCSPLAVGPFPCDAAMGAPAGSRAARTRVRGRRCAGPQGPRPERSASGPPLVFPLPPRRFLRARSSTAPLFAGRAGPRLYLGGRCGSHNKSGRLPVTGHPAHVMPGRYK